MAARVILAPVGAGKTEIVLRHLLTTLTERPFARIWVLLPTRRQEDSFRERLATYDPARRVLFNVEFFNFFDLNQRLLDAAGRPQRELTDTARYGLLRRVITELDASDGLPHFAAIAQTRGFARVVAAFIDELKRERIDPTAFLAAARTAKDRELAAIYDAYQDRLREHDLVDVEGEGWLAVSTLRDDPHLPRALDLLIVDGFDQFTTVQADLLALLARRASETLITLTTVPDREDTAGSRFARALADLHNRFALAGTPLAVEQVDVDTHPGRRHPDLMRLIATIFRRDAPPAASAGGVAFIEAPDPAAEMAALMRRVKRLLLQGTHPDAIMIALRDWDRYGDLAASWAARFGVPVTLHYGQPLAQNPAIIALLSLLDLPPAGFPRAAVIDALRSPYTQVQSMTPAAIALLDRLSRRFSVVQGWEQWREAITQATHPTWTDDGDRIPAMLTADQGAYLWADLSAFFNALIPPPQATVAQYVAWLERLIGPDPLRDDYPDEADAYEVEQGGYTLGMLAALRGRGSGFDTPPPEPLVNRDLTAMHTFKGVLRGLLTARDLLDALPGSAGPGLVAWEDFLADLVSAIDSAAVNAYSSRAGRVLVTTTADARGLPHDHVLIPGLAEGVFPMRVSEDALYLDSERSAFTRQGVTLRTQAERAGDDGVFYELICLPRESLTLSRPTVEAGKPWIASHLWRSAVAVFSDHDALIARDRLRPGQVVAPEDAAALDESLLAAAEGLNAPPHALPAAQRQLYRWLVAGDDAHQRRAWAHIRAMRALEMRRMSRLPHDAYTGRITAPDLLAVIAQKLGPDRVWSASQLNDLGTCGFRFFAGRLLRLESLEEPGLGMDAAQSGTLNHRILQDLYDTLRRDGKAIMPENRAYALERLDEIAAEVFAVAEEAYGFRAIATWEQEQAVILRRLREVVTADFAGPQSPLAASFGPTPRRPHRLELPFGTGREHPPVTVDLGGDAGSIHLRGVIDRVDQHGDRAIIIDYKSGSAPITHEDMRTGRNVQMLVYLLAAQSLLATDPALPGGVAGGLFWLLPRAGKGASGVLITDDADSQAVLEAARDSAAAQVAAARAGAFTVDPSKLENGKCARYCDFHRLCRLSVTHRHKLPPAQEDAV